MFVCNDKKLMVFNFNLRIGSCFHFHSAAYRKSDHWENVSEIVAEHNRNVFRQFIGNDPFVKSGIQEYEVTEFTVFDRQDYTNEW